MTLRVRIDLEAVAMNGYSEFPNSDGETPELL